MKVLLLLVVVGVAFANPIKDLIDSELDEHWSNYKSQFNKVYNGEVEENLRRLTWQNNLEFIREHNLRADMGEHKYWLGINEHADKTEEEFAQTNHGCMMNKESSGSTFLPLSHYQAPDTVDWRKQGYVTPVKNQAQCGSCWAFSTTGSLEGQWFKKTGKLVSLSEQQLVDCSKQNHGCQGGLMDFAFDYIKQNGGVDTEESYPYTAKNGQCKFNPNNVGATDTGYVDVSRGDEDALMQASSTIGPISVAIDASSREFQLYKRGVYTDNKCSSTRLDHGVLVVGYGEMDGDKYWLVKNSWGASWGDEGYIMMRRDQDNMCGIATQASYPLV